LIEKFDWGHVGRTGGRWDAKKLLHVQASHLRELDPGRVARLVVPFLEAAGLRVVADDPRLRSAIALVLPRTTTLPEVAQAVDYFFRDAPQMDAAAAANCSPRSALRCSKRCSSNSRRSSPSRRPCWSPSSRPGPKRKAWLCKTWRNLPASRSPVERPVRASSKSWRYWAKNVRSPACAPASPTLSERPDRRYDLKAQ
jgi:hypothetical protein